MKILPAIAITAAAIGSAVANSAAWGAPPLVTDDASTLVPGACQLEIEQRQFRNRFERDLVPVCNLWLDTEVGIGHQRVKAHGEPRTDSIVYQFKKVLLPAVDGSWAFGIGVATVRATDAQSGARQNIVNGLASRQLGMTALHLNVGYVSDREAAPGTRRNRSSWAIGAEQAVGPRWTFVGEAFGQAGLPETAQLGLRWWAVPKYVQLTTSVAAQRGEGSAGRWVSLGIRFETGDAIF